MLAYALNLAYFVFGLAILLAAWRLVRGPDLANRLLALDTLYMNALGLLVLVGIGSISAGDGRSVFFEVAVLVGLMGFVGTVAGARFLARGDAIE